MSAGTLDSSSDPPGGDRRPRVVRISAEREPYRTELTPVAFLRRSAYVFPEKTAVIHGARRYTYRQFEARSNRLASALRALGLGKLDRVAIIAPNTPAMLEAAVVAVSLGACAQPGAPAVCAAPLKPAREIDLYFGRDKQSGGEVSEVLPLSTSASTMSLGFVPWPVTQHIVPGGGVRSLSGCAGPGGAPVSSVSSCSAWNGSFLNFAVQSKRTIGLTTTSPTSNSLPIPPAVPVLITSFGCTSEMICVHTSIFGSCGPSCDMCESDLKTTTLFPPIRVVQYAPSRFACSAGQPARIFFDIVPKLCVYEL